MDIRTSPLVKMADEAKRPTRWWLAWIVAIVLIVVPGAVGSAIGTGILGNPARSDPKYQYGELFAFGVTLIGLFVWVRLKEGRKFSSLGLRGSDPAGKLLLGLLIGAVMMTIGVIIPLATGQYATGISVHTKTGTNAIVALIPLALVFLLQASTEELTTRGYMLQSAGRQTSASFAIIGSSVIFAVMHLDFRPIVLINITLYAVFASFVALGQGSLWMICGIHAAWNFFQGNIYGLPVSGHPYATTLLTIGPAKGSNDLITGGNYGVEASIIGTAVLVAGLIIAYVYYRRQAARRTVIATVATAAI